MNEKIVQCYGKRIRREMLHSQWFFHCGLCGSEIRCSCISARVFCKMNRLGALRGTWFSSFYRAHRLFESLSARALQTFALSSRIALTKALNIYREYSARRIVRSQKSRRQLEVGYLHARPPRSDAPFQSRWLLCGVLT